MSLAAAADTDPLSADTRPGPGTDARGETAAHQQAVLPARPGRRVSLEDLLPVLVADGLLAAADAEEAGRYAGLSGEQHALVALARRKLRSPATGRTLDMDMLCAWLARKVGLPHVRIDPLKVDLSRVADVMSSQYASSLSLNRALARIPIISPDVVSKKPQKASLTSTTE